MAQLNMDEVLRVAADTTAALFPDANPAAKLVEEAQELLDAVSADREDWALEELADCFICLADVVGKSRFTWGEIALAVAFKTVKCSAREWVFDETTRTYKHVK